MMKNIIPLTLFILLCYVPLMAQEKKIKAKFGKISEEEMAMKSYALDPGAPAVVLFDKAELSNRYNEQQGFLFEMEHHVRIKIFNKEAYYLADVVIPYFGDEKIADLRASSYNLENGVLVETKLDKDNVFDEKLTRYRRLKKLTIPAVREGTIIEFQYTQTNMDFDVPGWVFQDENIPKIWSEYKASVPSFIEFRKVAQGEVPFSLAQEEDRTNSSNSISYVCHEMHFIQENIPALKPEPFVTSINDYRSQINFDVRTIYKARLEPTGSSYGYKLVNGPPKDRNDTWENLGKELLEDAYEDPISSTKYTAEATAAAIAGKATTSEKIAALYEYVGKNYQSGNFDMIWMSETLENITKKKKGTPTDLNVVLINMLQRANVKAFPVAISTLDNGHIVPFRVSPSAFDRLITAVEADDSTILLLDAAAWPLPMGFLPEEDLNVEGLLMRDKGNITWIALQNKALVRSAVQANLSLTSEGKLSGAVSFSETGYGAVMARSRIKANNASAFLREKFSVLLSDGSFANLLFENLDNWQEANIKGTFDLETTGFATVSGNKIYLSPALGFGWKDNPFKNPVRKFNIELGVPRTAVYNFVFAIPVGYKVEEAPKSAKMMFGENGLIFEYFSEISPDAVKITVRRSIRQPYISVEHYADLQQFYGNIVSKLEEQVVLTKL